MTWFFFFKLWKPSKRLTIALMVYRSSVHLHITSLAPVLISSQICFCGAPLSSKPLFIISRWCTSLRCYRNNPIKWTAGELDRLSERLLNRCLSGHREAMVMTAGLESCSRGTRGGSPVRHTHNNSSTWNTIWCKCTDFRRRSVR